MKATSLPPAAPATICFRIRGVYLALMTLWFGFAVAVSPAVGQELTLEQAVNRAQRDDPWLQGSQYREQALQAQSIAAGTLPDPRVSFDLANFPTDTFEFNQEPMTQARIGVSQAFPRGHSRSLQRRRLSQLGARQPFARQDRQAQVAVTVSHLWLDGYKARESIRLIERDRDLFEHLVDVAEASYSSALGRTRQQDLVRAQLELTRLEDRITVLQTRQETAKSKLSEWLSAGDDARAITTRAFELADDLPTIELAEPGFFREAVTPESLLVRNHLLRHPHIVALDQKIAAQQTGVELAQQEYKPQWSVNASYAYRDDDPLARERADFFSVGVSFDVPLFIANRQDKQVESAVATAEAVKTEKTLALRSMLSEFETAKARLMRLDQRRDLYQSRLLEEMHEQAEAALTAYTNDDGDFAEVVRARIAELNARIEALDIDIERLKTIIQLNYFFTPAQRADGGAQ